MGDWGFSTHEDMPGVDRRCGFELAGTAGVVVVFVFVTITSSAAGGSFALVPAAFALILLLLVVAGRCHF